MPPGLHSTHLWVISLYFAYRALTWTIQRALIRRLTILEDLPLLGKTWDLPQRIKRTAVICGGSVSGLLTARICSSHFEKVIIVEPEDWLLSQDAIQPDTLAYLKNKLIKNRRTRIPQWRIIHGYYPTVFLLLSRIFGLKALDEEVIGSGGR
ncbi:hypothetical protein M422DRAFT_185693 [Sphaerobolus stellatus SS14]|uniref:Uncharacterized protein n=1 Tax=Sphaerobolus stellatus (strain SS14) TaxID=990650 RepID=A0A0C9V242_SPHS4|nr:hypothetical protein M422DRAFT_185693 [Sphaerobolus stellatus SS14]